MLCLQSVKGKPFVYGQNGPDAFDLLGIQYYCTEKIGVDFPREKNQTLLFNMGKQVEKPFIGDMLFNKKKDSTEELVGICSGLNGNIVIYLCGKTGEVIHESAFLPDFERHQYMNYF